jgi:alkylation response protein AidB-like acyl-CoA dehydrogenase
VNFDLTEDEEMLKALAQRFVGDRYDIERRRVYQSNSNGFASENWSLLGELGLIAAMLPAQDGGLDLGATGIATVFEQLGRGLVVEPLIENVLLAARLFAATAPEPLRSQWLPQLVSGEKRIALAHAEDRGRPGRLWVETRAAGQGDDVRLQGVKAYVPASGDADGYIVSARTSGAPGDPEGVGLFFVTGAADGLSRTSWRMADGSVAVTLSFDSVLAKPCGSDTNGASQIEAAETLASLARSAEALGVMEKVFADTQEYLRTREQFGSKLSEFQALQHRMVAQYAIIEQARGLLNLALVSWETPEFSQAVLGLRAYIAPTSVDLGQEMTQLHGGMGVSDELFISHALKRLLVLSRWPDDASAALDRFAGVTLA